MPALAQGHSPQPHDSRSAAVAYGRLTAHLLDRGDLRLGVCPAVTWRWLRFTGCERVGHPLLHHAGVRMTPNKALSLDGGIPLLFYSAFHWPAASEVRR